MTQPPDPTESPYQQLPSEINYEVPGSPHTAAEVADGGDDAIEAAEAALTDPGQTEAQSAEPEESNEEKQV
ncbi:MAG TPA: hypothetical protein VGJ60_07755 [Chloroflexota bacterium]|jgi:hypothetical protein